MVLGVGVIDSVGGDSVGSGRRCGKMGRRNGSSNGKWGVAVQCSRIKENCFYTFLHWWTFQPIQACGFYIGGKSNRCNILLIFFLHAFFMIF